MRTSNPKTPQGPTRTRSGQKRIHHAEIRAIFHILVDTPVFLTNAALAYDCHRASIADVDQLTGHSFRSLLAAGPFDCT